MDRDLTLQLKILTSGTEKLAAVQGAIDKTTKSASSNFANLDKKMESFGSRLNVMGQRMTWMVSVPLAVFGNKAVETYLEVEKSWVRFEKVFNGTAESMKELRKEASLLSVEFGIDIEEVNNVMAEFNKAGIDNTDTLKGLSRAVAETAILFDTDMKKSLDGVKSVMMGFNLTTSETEEALAALNIIADKTTASEEGILEVFNRSAGVARNAGFSYLELAASQGVFEKNAIPAGRAGNAMKSILTALTKQSNLAKDQFSDLGINMSGVSWRTANASEKMTILSKKFLEVRKSGDKIKLANLNEAMASLVGKFQVNNLNVLLEDMAFAFDDNADTVSVYQQALDVAADSTENMAFWEKQLDKVMESDVQKVARLKEEYRKMQVELGEKLLPVKIALLNLAVKLLESFNNLSPGTQDLILKFTGLVIVFGPLMMGLGLLIQTLGFVFSGAKLLTSGISTMSSTMGGSLINIAKTSSGLQLGLLGALTAVTVYITTKAIQSYNALQKTLDSLKTQNEETTDRINRTHDALNKLPDGPYKEKMKAMEKNTKELKDEAQRLVERYEGFPGIFNAVGDELVAPTTAITKLIGSIADAFYTMYENAKKAIKEAKKLKNSSGGGHGGGGGGGWANGGVIHAANGMVARGVDTIPAMLRPGEMVLNKGQQNNLFDILQGRNQAPATAGGGITINFNVGNMIASEGEQREFARKIEEYITENANRK